jgi:hypothetical protein
MTGWRRAQQKNPPAAFVCFRGKDCMQAGIDGKKKININ